MQPALDQYFPRHGNWNEISLGWTSAIWLTYILPLGGHRLNHVEDCAEKPLETLKRCTGQGVRAFALSDDRLESILLAPSDDQRWGEFETALNQHLLRVYDLNPQRVSLDSTWASGYWTVIEGGLFQFGPTKDHRPECAVGTTDRPYLPQVKAILSTIDTLGMPVATEVLSGESADDPWYIPAIAQLGEGVEQVGLLYVGNCKMAPPATRASAHAGGDFCLCPLRAMQTPKRIHGGLLLK